MVIKKLKKLNRRHFDKFGKWMEGFFDNPRDFLRVVLPQGVHNFTLENEDIVFSMDNPRRLGEVATIKGDLGEFMGDYYLSDVERKVKDMYDLEFEEIGAYEGIVDDILVDGDEHILRRLDIPVVDPYKFYDAYRRVLYYVTELCENGREIRADFFKSVS